MQRSSHHRVTVQWTLPVYIYIPKEHACSTSWIYSSIHPVKPSLHAADLYLRLAVMACTCGWARMAQECNPWCRSKCATPFFVMDLLTLNRLIVCSRACLESMPDVLFEAANESDTGSVLILHVREDGQQMSTFEVHKLDPQRLDTIMRWIDDESQWSSTAMGKAATLSIAQRQGHAHMCVWVWLYMCIPVPGASCQAPCMNEFS